MTRQPKFKTLVGGNKNQKGTGRTPSLTSPAGEPSLPLDLSLFHGKMEQILSPNPSLKQRLPRIQSPTTPFFLGSNDDKLERAQARAARAAAIRRKPISALASPHPGQNSDPCLDKQQILDLFQNCIKLASENVRLAPVPGSLLLFYVSDNLFVHAFLVV